MKLTIERSNLLRALGHVQSIVERRNTIPILSNVLLDASDGSLKMTATDLDIAIVESTACEVDLPGGITAPAHTLYDIARKLPDGAQVELVHAADENRLLVRSGKSDFALMSLPKEDFPVMSDDDLPYRFNLPGQDLARLFEKARFAISTEETRYYLNGIYLHPAGDDGSRALRAVATDGHRLARVEIPLPVGAEDMPGIIVPRKTVMEIHKLIGDNQDDIEIALSDAKIRFTLSGAVLTSKLIDGTFPDYERVIPSGNDKIAEVDAVEFAKAVDRVSTISSEKSRAVKLEISADRIIISANSPESGSATEEVSIDFEGEGMEIGFNSRYLLDICNQIGSGNAQFIMRDAGSPTIIRDISDVSALYVLMPMRV